MADRTVYGLTVSENGWRMVDQDSCVWVKVPGTNVSLQIREGQPAKIMGAFAADFNAYVEPLRDADSACWTATNSVASSNHLSGTAMDLNWNSHPFRVADAGFNGAQIRTVRELLDFYEDTIFWGNDWNNPKDAMHFQMSYTSAGPKNFDRINDFIRRKIRADGFSTFRRSSAPPPAPAAPPAVDVLARAMGATPGVDYAALLPAVTQCLHECDCTSVNRIAMWMAQVGHESAGLKYMEEIASGAAYEGRSDLGNTQPGDGVRFKGRGPIQVTGRHNYTVLSKWAFDKGLVPSPTFFVDQPAQLGSARYGFMGVTWYWTTQRPMNDAADAKDIVRATQYVNGGQNGIDDRRTRYNRALGMGDQLLTLNSTGDDMAQVPQDQWDRVYRELTQRLPSRSPLRYLNQNDHYPDGLVDTVAGFALNIDGMTHVEHVRALAGYGHPPTLALLREVAGADPNRYPDRQDDAKLAQAILAEVETKQVQPQVMTAAAPEPQVVYVDRPADTSELDAARAEIERLKQQLNTPQPTNGAVVPLEAAGTTGQVIGRAYDALQQLRLADALPIEDRAPLAALISVLQTKNGSELS